MSRRESEFDRAVEEARDSGESRAEDLEGVQILLKQAGVSDAKIAEIRANPSMVALIKGNPDLAERLAQMFPAAYAINYYEQRNALGFGLPAEDVFTSGGPDAMARNIQAQQTEPSFSQSGALEYPGGVIVDQTTQTVLFPPTDASIQGSPAWMAQIPRWGEAKMQQWAKTLKKHGYIESNKVDLATFTQAMAQYHQYRYLYGGGKPVDLSATKQDKVTRDDFGGILDPAVVDTEVIPWFQETFGDDPNEDELASARRFLTKAAVRLARKGLDPADAASVASARAQQRFRNDPATQKWQELEETDTALHDSFVNLFQVLSG